MQKNNKRLLNDLSERIEKVEKNLVGNLKNKPNSNAKEYSYGIRTLFELILGFLIGGFFGYCIDLFLLTSPLFILLGIFLGGISGIYTIWKKNIYENKNE